MATILSKDLKVKNGQLIKVQNDNRKKFSNEAKTYYALWVKDIDNSEYCIMFTEKEFYKCEKVLGTFDDAFILGQVYTFDCIKNKTASKILIKVNHVNGDETCIFLNKQQFEKLKLRGEKNIEDQPEKSWLTNLFD